MRLDLGVAVVGGGLAGLTVAHRLHRAGIECTVLEAAQRPGGRIRSVQLTGGVIGEAGLEEFWQGGGVYPLLAELGLPITQDAAHSTVVLRGELRRARPGQDRAAFLSTMFEPAEAVRFDRLEAQVERIGRRADHGLGLGLGRISLRDHLQSTIGRNRVTEWTRVTIESETAVEWDRIAAADGLAELRPFLNSPHGFGELNAHVDGGNERLIDALVGAVPTGTVRTGRRVIRVRDRGDRVEIDHRSGTGRTVTSTVPAAVVTVPAWDLPGIEWDLPADSPGPATSPRPGSYRKVLLCLDSGTGARVGTGGLFTLLTDSAAGCLYLRPGTDGQDDLLTMLIPGAHARRFAGLADAEMIDVAVGLLERLTVRDETGAVVRPFHRIGRHVRGAVSFDHPRAVAYWPVCLGRSRFDAAADGRRRLDGRVLFAGDTTESSHSDGAVGSAERVAAALSDRLGGRVDRPGERR